MRTGTGKGPQRQFQVIKCDGPTLRTYRTSCKRISFSSSRPSPGQELLHGFAANEDQRTSGGDHEDREGGGGGQRRAEHVPRLRQEGQRAGRGTHG